MQLISQRVSHCPGYISAQENAEGEPKVKKGKTLLDDEDDEDHEKEDEDDSLEEVKL